MDETVYKDLLRNRAILRLDILSSVLRYSRYCAIMDKIVYKDLLRIRAILRLDIFIICVALFALLCDYR